MQSPEEKFTPLVDAAFAGDWARVRILLEQGADVNEMDSYHSTALHWACNHNNLETVRLLLEYGADVNIQDNGGEDAFYLASDNGASAILKLLWEAGVDRSRYPNDQS